MDDLIQQCLCSLHLHHTWFETQMFHVAGSMCWACLVCVVVWVAAGRPTSISPLTTARCCAQWSVSNNGEGVITSPTLSQQINIKACTSAPLLIYQTCSRGAFSCRGLPKRGKVWAELSRAEQGERWLSSDSKCAHMLLRRAGDRDKLLVVHQSLCCWPLSAFLSGCCLRMIPETLGWRPVCTDRGSFAQISEELMTVFAFMFVDIKTFRHAYLLQLTQDRYTSLFITRN